MAKIRIGSDAGNAVYDLIWRAKRRLLIVSPWLSPACADIALQKHRSGVTTVIVTTNDENKGHQLALSRLIKKSKKRGPVRWWLLIPGLAMIFFGLFALFQAVVQGTLAELALPLLLLAVGAALCLAGRGKAEKKFVSLVERLVLYLPKDPPLHAKLYVADDTVAVSSANFTVSGLKHNVECAVFCEDAELAGEAVRQIDELLSREKVAVFCKE
ncbi:MAG: phospholipase D family protein [Hadesarchaea archaeon]|nr:phospholipase D family protein [Hadesarchaea archaeon]